MPFATAQCRCVLNRILLVFDLILNHKLWHRSGPKSANLKWQKALKTPGISIFPLKSHSQSCRMGCGRFILATSITSTKQRKEMTLRLVTQNKRSLSEGWLFTGCLRVLLLLVRTSRTLCGYLDSSDLIQSKERLVSTSLANLVQVWCRSNMWPGYVISARSCCKSASFPRTKMGLTYRDGGRDRILARGFLWNCVKSQIDFECSHANSLHVICLFFPTKWFYFLHSKLARRPQHCRFEMVKSRAAAGRDPARSLCSAATVALWLRDYGEKEGRNWEVLRKRGREKEEQERERAGSPGFLSHPLRHPVLSLTHRPTFYLTYLALAFSLICHSAWLFL